MIQSRHLRHPIRTGQSLLRRIDRFVNNWRANRQFSRIRRSRRERCWCGGDLLPFKWHTSYGICRSCGTFVNRRPPLQEELSKVYSIDLYWRTRQKLKGFPSIEDRAALYRRDGRLNRWLDLIEQYGPGAGTAIEVGCSPGVLLEELSSRGYSCTGVEISEDVAAWLRENTRLDIRSGFFPGVDLPRCHLFLAFDVLEHSPAPDEFMREVSRCLLPAGIAILQTAIDRYDYKPPFGERFDMFDDIEHTFLFTDEAIKRLSRLAGLEVISLKERIWLAGEICILKKP